LHWIVGGRVSLIIQMVRSGQLSATIGAEIASVPSRFQTALIRKVSSGEIKNLDQARAACSGIKEAAAQTDIFGASPPKATATEMRTLASPLVWCVLSAEQESSEQTDNSRAHNRSRPGRWRKSATENAGEREAGRRPSIDSFFLAARSKVVGVLISNVVQSDLAGASNVSFDRLPEKLHSAAVQLERKLQS
jgi:hypothetical protein